MNEKCVIFIEDLSKPFYDLLSIANRFIRFNQTNDTSFKHSRSIFDVQLRNGTEDVYDRVLKVYFTSDTETIDPNKCKHTSTREEIVEPALCYKEGKKNIVCKKCGIVTNVKMIPKTSHSYGEFVTIKEPTCSSPGTKRKICKICGGYHDEIIPKLEHEYGNEYIAVEPTCSQEGVKEKKCIHCENIVVLDPIPKLEHDWNMIEQIDSTCASDGLVKFECSHCHEILEQTIDKKEHEMENYWIIDKEATCASEGSMHKDCLNCDHSEIQSIPMKDHIYTDWEIIISPTYSDSGLERAECINCGNVIERVIPKLPFDIFIQPDSLDDLMIGMHKTVYLTANVGSLKWSIIAGNLPEGSVLHENGVLDLVSEENGTFTFTVKAGYPEHEDELFATKEYTLNVTGSIFTVTFDAGTGHCEEAIRRLPEGQLIGELPIATHDNLVFGGWFTAPIDGLKLDENYTITTNITLYARYGESSDINFGDAVTQFNIGYKGDRTNYANHPYDFYSRYSDGRASNLKIQTGISSEDRSNNMSDTNKEVILYMKVTNMGEAGKFDIGFHCDSYVVDHGNDHLMITRLDNGVQLSDAFSVTVSYPTSIWIGKYSERTNHLYEDVSVGTSVGTNSNSGNGAVDTGYAFTINDIFINSKSYAILQVTFKILD